MDDEIRLAASPSLQVIFSRRHDRWGHRIEWIHPAGRRIDFTSEEGSSSDDWPPSPPLQTLDVQELSPGRRVVFFVGMAGSAHWSAAVEARPETSDLLFDVACRCTVRPPRLGSRYRLGPMPSTAGIFSILPLSDDCRRVLEATVEHVSIRVEPSPAQPPYTIRWRYVVTGGQGSGVRGQG